MTVIDLNQKEVSGNLARSEVKTLHMYKGLMSAEEKHAATLKEAIAQRERQIVERDEQILESERQIAKRDEQILERGHKIASMKSSASWRLTAPLRELLRGARKVATFLEKVIGRARWDSALFILNQYSPRPLRSPVDSRSWIESARSFLGRLRFALIALWNRHTGKLSANGPDSSSSATQAPILQESPGVFSDVDRGAPSPVRPISDHGGGETPRLALVTPSYNQAHFLRATIESVLSQGYPNLSYAVRDGGSTDGSVDILAAYGDRLNWWSGPDSGQTAALNAGFAQVDGDVMGYLNSDDLLLAGSLAYIAKAFTEYPGVDVVYGHRVIVDETGSEIGRWILPPHDPVAIRWADFIPQETMFWRRRVWDEIGPFDESFRYAMDWDFILRAHAAGFKFKRLPRAIGCFRVHVTQKTTAMIDVGASESARLRQRSLGYVPTQQEVEQAIRPYIRRHKLFKFMNGIGVFPG
jgi:hypothetical protein